MVRGKMRMALLVSGVTVAVASVPAAATPADNGEHRVTICHVTESSSNPWVQITVDRAAFDGEGDDDHSHHVSSDGRRDFLLVAGTCENVDED